MSEVQTQVQNQAQTQKRDLVFIKAFSGKSKKGNDFNSITLLQTIVEDDGKLVGVVLDMFVPNPIELVKTLNCGDVVSCEFSLSERLDRGLELTNITTVVRKSPFLK